MPQSKSVIQLGSVVRVSDPCYTDDVWCVVKLKDVMPGNYVVDVSKEDGRPSSITVYHQQFKSSNLFSPYYNLEFIGEIGVDSGQAGFFDETSYRKDDLFRNKLGGEFSRQFSPEKDGDIWYGAMCDMTLSGDLWGSYSSGVVSQSGWGDGSYPLYVKRAPNGKIVAMRLVFISDEDQDEDGDE